MKIRTTNLIIPVASLLTVLGCAARQESTEVPEYGPVATAPEAPTEAPPPAPPEVVAAPATWAEAQTKEQKMAFMAERVVPAMAPLFQAADPEEYAEFGCATCHGPKYEPATVFLPALTMKGGNITAFAAAPEVSKFMAEQVVPAMAQVLGQEPYNMETHQGFGCGGCHGISME